MEKKEQYTIYGKRPPSPPDGKVRRLLNVGRRKKSRSISDALFKKLDTDNSGLLSRDEYAAASSFESVDANHDGFIDKEELYRLSQSESKTSIEHEIEEIEDSIGQLEPLERQSFRLAGFDPYILVSVLTAGESFDVVSNYHPGWANMAGKTSLSQLTTEDVYTQVLLCIGAASTLLGSYAAVTFALTVLYGKTAIGLDKDEAYYAYLDTTGLQRFRAFKAFTASLGLFCVIVFLELVEKTPSVLRLPVALICMAFLYFGRSEYKFIIDSAGPIFAPNATAAVSEDNDTEE